MVRADRFVCDKVAQSARLGEPRSVREARLAVDAIELGQVIAGEMAGWTSDRDITICDLTGTGAQDTAIASLAAERCQAWGVGIVIETWLR